ncbi:MAG: putative Glycosyl transferase [Frankiales bacterium]|nr:putative Glycosyl transferase [Frankiales bacterium]
MRAGVYNRYLDTLGGGERYTGMLAAVLAQHVEQLDQVDLIGHGEVDLGTLQEHLGIAMSGVNLVLVPDLGEQAISDLSADYDVFVNASYMSRIVSQAPRGSYVVYFPTPWDHDLTRLQKRIARTLGPAVRATGTPYEYQHGWFPPEGGRRRSYSWTSEAAELLLSPGPARELRLEVGRPGAPEDCLLQVEVEGEVLTTAPVRREGFSRVRVALPPSGTRQRIRLLAPTFEPTANDNRRLGVAVARVQFGGGRFRVRERLGYRLPYLRRETDHADFLDSYQQIVSISAFTEEWVTRLWHRPSELLFPPVHTKAIAPAPKKNQILSIGRFFARGRGHNKKQLEMVKTFVELQRRGELAGWEYHLVGGCSSEDEHYLEKVRAAAAGFPVHIHANAPRPVVEELLGSARLFWHATGLGEDIETRPWVFEHFGITTVEAMAAGCVPVVIDKAGQPEIVRHGTDGYLFSTLEQLQQHTRELAADDTLRLQLSANAVERAHTFSEHAFADRGTELAQKLLSAAVTRA